MEDGLFQWSEFMVQLLNKLVLKALGPSLGLYRMWTKKNDHAQKNECVDSQGAMDWFVSNPA